ncbi:MAG TPA: hypothetical protein VNA04_09905, partial [Thermoanaerobaculia bacterium]|nr:hypothetical protein [Thermoanaerobaculia bacterium]
MLSKTIRRARIALSCLLVAGCQLTTRPVTERAPRTEVNLAFAVEDNLLRLSTVTIDGRPGRFFLGSAHGRTLL